MFSIYTSLYNASKIGFNWKAALKNWSDFLPRGGQIVIAVNKSEDNTYNEVCDYINKLRNEYASIVEYQILDLDISYKNPEFDGIIKNEALKQCTRDYCILLDIDEMIPLYTQGSWIGYTNAFTEMGVDALMIPSIDLFNSEKEYKSLGQKFYLHVNSPNICRGTVNYAKRSDGTIDITKSDTTEPIYKANANLVSYFHILDYRWTESMKMDALRSGQVPFVFHLGWLSKDQRLKQSAFWSDVWNARNGSSVEKPKTMNELDRIAYKSHNLEHWDIKFL